MQIARNWLPRIAVLFVVVGCALFEPQSKVKSGTLFVTGQVQYDEYFTKVHALQVESTGFADDKKSSRRALIDALKIANDSVDVTILEAAHERMVAIAHVVNGTHLDLREDEGHVVLTAESRADLSMRDFVKSLQSTVDSEIKRKRSLRDVPQKCDELVKTGRELEPRVKADFFRQGGTMMADVHDEMVASFEVLDQISKTSRQERRETEDFISDLGRAVAAEPSEYLRGEGVAAASSGKPAGTSKPVATVAATTPKPKPPVTQNTTPVATTPKPKPPVTKPSGGGDEVFNP